MKKPKRMLSLILVVIMLCVSNSSAINVLADNPYTPRVLCEVQAGQKLTIGAVKEGVAGSTNLSFEGEGDLGFVAKVRIYDINGELIEQMDICKRSKSWSELYFYGGKRYEIEVLLGTLEVTYNMATPQWKIEETGNQMDWTVRTTFKDVYLTVGDTIQYGMADVYPGYSAWLDEDYYRDYSTKTDSAFKTDNRRIATVDQDGIITAVQPGETTINIAYRFGYAEDNSILYTSTCTVTVLEDYGMEEAYKNYFADGTERYFNIVGVNTREELTDIDVEFDGQQYNTGDGHEIMIDIPDDNQENVIFSKEGYYTQSLDPKYISRYNFITLYPEDEGTDPVIKSVMGCDLSNNVWQNLRVRAMSVKNGGNYCIDVDIDWKDHKPLAVWVQQGNKKVTFGEYNTSGFIHLGDKLTTDGGPVYLCAQTEDGTVVSTPVLINVYAPVEVFELDFGDENDVKAEANNVDGFDGIPFEMKLGGTAPASFKVDADGKVKGTLGITLLGGENNDYVYNTISEGLSEKTATNGEAVDVTEMIDRLEGNSAAEPQWLKKNLMTSCDMLVLGCFEGRLINGKIHITDINIAACFKAEVKYTRQSIAFNVPYYWTVGVKMAIESQLIAVQEDSSGSIQIQFPSIIFEVEFTGALSLGVQGLAGVGAELAASIKAKVPTGLDPVKRGVWTLEVTFFPLVQAFGFELKLETWNKLIDEVIYDGSSPESLAMYESQRYVMLGRSYLTSPEVVNERVVSEDQTLVTETVFTDLYPDSQPQIVSRDGKNLLVWIGDDAERTEENRTCLYYSVYDGETDAWSKPVAVMDNEKADYQPKLYEVGDGIHLVWLKANTEFAQGITLSETAAELDVYYSKFDVETGEFSEPVNLSNSEHIYDFDPYVTSTGQGLTVVWGSNHDNDMFSAVESYSITAATLTENGWEAETMAENLAALNGFAACEKDGELCVYVSAHTDGQIGTMEDLELYSIDQGQVLRLTENTYIDSAPECFGGNLYWYVDGKLTDGENAISFPTQKTNYMIISNADQTVTAVVYSVLSNDKHDLYVTINNGSGWGEPVCVTDFDDRYIADFSACFDGNQLITMANLRLVNSDGTFGPASLVKSSKTVFADVEIVDAYYEPCTLFSGGVLKGSVTLVNRGMYTVEDAYITVMDSETHHLATVKASDLPILPGEIKKAEFLCKVDDIQEDQIKVSVSVPGITEMDTENNLLELTVDKYDVSVENAYITTDPDGNSTISVFLMNRGMENLSEIELIFAKDDPDGEEIGKLTVDELAVGETKLLTYEIGPGVVDQIVYIEAQIGQRENFCSNNRNFVYLDMIRTDIGVDMMHLPGDVNGDGEVTEADVLTLRRYLVGGYDVEVNEAVCDINQDGSVNGKDVVTLRRSLGE